MNRFFALLKSQEFAEALAFLRGVVIDGSQAKVWKSDAQKVELFVRDCFAYVLGEASKAFDAIKQGDPTGAEIVMQGLMPFVGEAEVVLRAYAKRSESLAKFQFPKDIWGGKYKDPFKPERKLAAEFKAKWLS